MRLPLAVLAWLLAAASPAFATVFAAVHGIVHDPQHRPVAGAHILLKAVESDFSVAATTGSDGSFKLSNVPIGAYTLEIQAAGFAPVSEPMALTSGTNAVVHIPLELAATTQNVVVHATDGAMAALDTTTPTTLITQEQIQSTPGASRTLGMQMITDYVPGAYVTHDMLHIRGGHQTSWLIDGVSIPNTKIDANVGPQIDPKDIDQLEVQRGSYGADVGDRTYGVFDVLPRNGFEYNHEGELMVSGGNLNTGEAQLSLGDHSAKTAWYASATGSRSDYGLQTPVPEVVHDATNSLSGFLSLIRNQTSRDQLRLTAQLRQDHFQVPYDPNAGDWQNSAFDSSGLRDAQTERDSFVLANWVHTISPRAMVEFAPFWHWNQANYDSSAEDLPVATTWHQSSHYAGMQADARADAGPNNLAAGLYSFAQWENDRFALLSKGSGGGFPTTDAATTAGLVEAHLSDHLHLGRYVTLLGGLRISSYHSALTENVVYPRVGATAEIPRLHWVLRGFYGRFFQPAPVITVSSALLNFIQGQPEGPNTITPLPSERDEEHQFGIQIPYRGWSLDVDTFRTRVNNYLDHANVGESNLYFPISVDGALVRAWEMTLRSPQIARLGQFHLAYSNQIAEQRGGITGGYTCSLPTDPACNAGFSYAPLDHDQRHTLNTGFNANLPARTWFAANVYYGSGFVNGLEGSGIGPYQGAYLPAHATFDISAGHSFGEHWRVSASAVNVLDHRVLLDNSVTLGGFHYNDPRIVTGELRYRFRF